MIWISSPKFMFWKLDCQSDGLKNWGSLWTGHPCSLGLKCILNVYLIRLDSLLGLLGSVGASLGASRLLEACLWRELWLPHHFFVLPFCCLIMRWEDFLSHVPTSLGHRATQSCTLNWESCHIKFFSYGIIILGIEAWERTQALWMGLSSFSHPG